MELENIKSTLSESFEDFRLSTAEKHSFVVRLTSIKQDSEKLSFARNFAFDLVNEAIRQEQVKPLVALKWLKGIVKSIDQIQESDASVEQSAWFSPGKDCERKIIQLIKNARRTIKVCVFTISNDKISHALIEAHKKNIEVLICSDNHKSQDLGSDIEQMARLGIPVKLDQSENHMHHKFAIFDDEVLLNGSFNWTRSASQYNDENIIVSNDRKLIHQFNREFLALWEKCKTL